MSSEWIENVLKKLGEDHTTTITIKGAIQNNKLRTGVAGIDKKTGELKILPVIIKKK